MKQDQYVRSLLSSINENIRLLKSVNYNLYNGNFDTLSGYTREGIIVSNLSNINQRLSIHNIVYKLINTVNGNFYIGKHTTRNPLDSYYGSGIILHEAELKYNLSSFTKEILFDFLELSDCYNKEAELVPEISCHLYNECCYNMKAGGYGGQASESAKRSAQTRKLHGYVYSSITKNKISKSTKGKKKSEIHKLHLSENHRFVRDLTILFEDDMSTITVKSSICAIAKQYNVNLLNLKRCSRRGIFINGIRILTLLTNKFLYTKSIHK